MSGLPPLDHSASHDADAQTSAAGSQPTKVSVWEDFIDILYVPSAVFARRERGSFWIPMLVVAVLIGGIFFATSGVLQPIIDAEFDRATAVAMENDPQLTPEMMEGGRRFSEIIAKAAAFVGPPIAVFFTGLVLWGVGKFVDATQSLHAALVVAAYSCVPKVLDTLLAGMQGLFLDPAQLDGRYRLSLGVGRFLDPDTASPVLIALLGRLDVFTIWVTVLLAIGLAVTGKISRPRAGIAAAVVWVIGALPGTLQALQG
ncbi:MAG: YIP1 family protein [Gemmatimonadota bacterium]|nr:YIP1 family protein [Gemmatimonadota bacterium]